VTDSPTDALAFFLQSCGRWRSRRSSHHLLHRRAESGNSFIEVLALEPEDPRLIAIATLHGQDPTGLVGGCQVRWSGSMAWDKAGEAHEGESLFGLIPTDDLGREGLLLRDRGYAETAPVAGRFAMDANDELLLTTDYETMSSVERFMAPTCDCGAAPSKGFPTPPPSASKPAWSGAKPERAPWPAPTRGQPERLQVPRRPHPNRSDPSHPWVGDRGQSP
jgi:hypothetical protein